MDFEVIIVLIGRQFYLNLKYITTYLPGNLQIVK